MTDLDTFDQYSKLSEKLIADSTKDQLAECCRLLALNLAHHQGKNGEIPLDETLAIFISPEPNDEKLTLLVDSMVNLVGMLGHIHSGLGEDKH